jgi:hypothetical protein
MRSKRSVSLSLSASTSFAVCGFGSYNLNVRNYGLRSRTYLEKNTDTSDDRARGRGFLGRLESGHVGRIRWLTFVVPCTTVAENMNRTWTIGRNNFINFSSRSRNLLKASARS